jgi:valyl-tRNA synthetase
MKAIELAKAYDPKSFEDRIYEEWLSRGLFKPAGEAGRKPFVIVIPPPNVTGVLHMGHGLNNSLQDILIRYHRMLGDPTLWVPGTDHAGIATQHVVEKKLRAKGLDRHQLGREMFVEETWKVADEHHAIIKKQLQKIGSSCDWDRERFTLDKGLSRAVREVFVTLYERGLVYKGKYLVNWCTSCGTALSDDEVEHEEISGSMHHIRYKLADGVRTRDGSEYIEIATTRPETLLGDTAVAAHPDDERYGTLIGKMVELPLTGRLIPIIADSYVDREFGTGLVKITPGHDPNDFEVGNRHELPRINILNPDGTLNESVPAKYRGLKIKEARAAVIADLKAEGLYIAEKPIVHSVGHCYRCNTVVEPYLSEQWFVRMKPLAEKALKAWRDGEVRFFPQRWETTYEHWLTNIRDWCISRQLWWGHRIPAWRCKHCGKDVIAREDPLECPFCKSTDLVQDEDVLDTWFSSWLWPFSTLGWPDDSADLRKFYPTTVLVTAFDIIFFWVARMIMAGMEFMGKSPFADVCMTTLVRDKQGRKMSKSLGNGIDPLEIVEDYGADALRFTIAFMFTSTQDILMDKDDFKLGSKFANKIWNASRYILMNLEGRELVERPELHDIDRWIYGRLAAASGAVRSALATYRFNDAAAAVYEYFWNDFCDWYVEATKLSFRFGDDREKDRAVSVLIDVLAESLALLHPFLPFVTEEIYQKLPGRGGDMLITRPYPQAESKYAPRSATLDSSFEALRELVRLVRTMRGELGIAPEAKIRLALRFEGGFEGAEFLRASAALIGLLAGAVCGDGIRVEEAASRPEGAIALVGRGFEIYAFVKETIDAAKLVEKLRKDVAKDEEYAARADAKLANPGFSSSAPPDVIAKERGKLEEVRRRINKYKQYLEELA